MMVLEYTLELKHKNKTARRMRLSKKSKEVKSPPIMNNNGWRFRLGDGGGGGSRTRVRKHSPVGVYMRSPVKTLFYRVRASPGREFPTLSY